MPVKCTYCGSAETKVVDSRDSESRDAIRRRRECLSCQRRFTTYERVEEVPLTVLKRDGEREIFSPSKLLEGLLKACEKRPIERKTLLELVNSIEAGLRSEFKAEAPSAKIGERVLTQLKELDKVAYLRFASVYRKFEDVEEFQRELARLTKTKSKVLSEKAGGRAQKRASGTPVIIGNGKSSKRGRCKNASQQT